MNSSTAPAATLIPGDTAEVLGLGPDETLAAYRSVLAGEVPPDVARVASL